MYWADLTTGASGGRAIVTAPDGTIHPAEVLSSAPLVVDRYGLALSIVDDCRWEIGGAAGDAWSGRVRADDDLELELNALQGFAEEARQRR